MLNVKYFVEGNASKRMKGSGGIVIASKNAADERSGSSAMTASSNTQKQGSMSSSFEKVSQFNLNSDKSVASREGHQSISSSDTSQKQVQPQNIYNGGH